MASHELLRLAGRMPSDAKKPSIHWRRGEEEEEEEEEGALR